VWDKTTFDHKLDDPGRNLHRLRTLVSRPSFRDFLFKLTVGSESAAAKDVDDTSFRDFDPILPIHERIVFRSGCANKVSSGVRTRVKGSLVLPFDI